VGTFLFFLTAYVATQAAKNSAADGSSQSVTLLLYISLSFALALTANVWLFYRVSGGLFNPALTAAFVALRLMTPAKGALLAAAQLLAGVAAAGVAKALVPGHALAVRTTLAPDVTVAQGFFVEFFLTAELALAVFMIAVEKHRATHLAPLVIGAALGVGHLVGASLTGASMNPARSFGPALVDLDFASEHWIYCMSPADRCTSTVGLWALTHRRDRTAVGRRRRCRHLQGPAARRLPHRKPGPGRRLRREGHRLHRPDRVRVSGAFRIRPRRHVRVLFWNSFYFPFSLWHLMCVSILTRGPSLWDFFFFFFFFLLFWGFFSFRILDSRCFGFVLFLLAYSLRMYTSRSLFSASEGGNAGRRAEDGCG